MILRKCSQFRNDIAGQCGITYHLPLGILYRDLRQGSFQDDLLCNIMLSGQSGAKFQLKVAVLQQVVPDRFNIAGLFKDLTAEFRPGHCHIDKAAHFVIKFAALFFKLLRICIQIQFPFGAVEEKSVEISAARRFELQGPGNDDHRELQPLGGMNGHNADTTAV